MASADQSQHHHEQPVVAGRESDSLPAADPEKAGLDASAVDSDGKPTEVVHEFPEGGLRAWLTASGTALIMFSTLGYVNSWGVYQSYYELHQLSANTPTQIAWIGSLQGFFVFAGGLFGGPMFDRWGEKVIRPAALFYVLSFMLTSLCTEYWHFMLAQGVFGGISLGMTMCPSMAATGQYFNKKRGAAMGLVIAGSSVGGVVWPIALSKMLASDTLGFGWSVRVVGFVILAVLAYATFGIKARLPPRRSGFLLLGAFRDPVYCLCIASTFFLFMGMFTPFFFLPSYAVGKGMDTVLAGYLLAILNGASFPGRVLPGVLADKFGRYNMLLAMSAASGVVTLCWTKCETNAGIVVFAVAFGFCSGAIVSGASVTLASCPKDPKNIGTYMGMGLFLSSFAALISPPINGALLPTDDGFFKVSILSGVLLLVGGALVAVAKTMAPKGLWAKA
ncbi:putative monocarboxylate permease [Podospora appendiculata]|uniref:Monocarboxylate permease n=1 Tax=Podospora appendiculata TaxID=314037 RepID=A0AAE1CFV2_9PEZI|nr:putative monocarboxylate permease [Podospora appendiculata]